MGCDYRTISYFLYFAVISQSFLSIGFSTRVAPTFMAHLVISRGAPSMPATFRQPSQQHVSTQSPAAPSAGQCNVRVARSAQGVFADPLVPDKSASSQQTAAEEQTAPTCSPYALLRSLAAAARLPRARRQRRRPQLACRVNGKADSSSPPRARQRPTASRLARLTVHERVPNGAGAAFNGGDSRARDTKRDVKREKLKIGFRSAREFRLVDLFVFS